MLSDLRWYVLHVITKLVVDGKFNTPGNHVQGEQVYEALQLRKKHTLPQIAIDNELVYDLSKRSRPVVMRPMIPVVRSLATQ